MDFTGLIFLAITMGFILCNILLIYFVYVVLKKLLKK